MLALLRGLIGSFYAAIPPASAALIADRTGPERRAQGMAVLGAANGVGIILGPLMGGLLVRELGLTEWHGGLIITLAGVCWMLLSRA